MSVNLKVRNYRCLRNVDWTPSGVCALTGPNGSGKTTLLSVFELLRNAYLRSFPEAIANPYVGGIVGLKNFLALPEEPVDIEFRVHRADGGWSAWRTELLVSGGGIDGRAPESVIIDGATLFERKPYADHFPFGEHTLGAGHDLAIRTAYDITFDSRLEPLAEGLQRSRLYRQYSLWNLRQNGSRVGADLYLHPSGANVFTVLANWISRKDLRPQYESVKEGMCAAFPDSFQDFDFVVGGQNTNMRLYLQGIPHEIPHHLAPDGFLVAMMHLTAIAGAQQGSLIGIDEVENSLHPFAIRQLVSSFRDFASERDLTIVLATHSPVVLDEFAADPSQIHVMESGEETLPISLTDHRDPEWLAHFSLGSLYASFDYGGPRIEPTHATPRE